MCTARDPESRSLRSVSVTSQSQLELQLVADRDAVRADFADRGLDRLPSVVDRAGSEGAQAPAAALVEAEGGEVGVRRHEPGPADAGGPELAADGIEERTPDPLAAHARDREKRLDLGLGRLARRAHEVRDEADREAIQLGDQDLTLEGIHELA